MKNLRSVNLGHEPPPSPAPDYRAIAERLAAALEKLRKEHCSMYCGVVKDEMYHMKDCREARGVLDAAHDAGIGRGK